jgi:hypothetical protein
MTRIFSFAEGDRKYQCRVERATAGRTEAWWWFEVSGDAHRYAPFHAAASDTEASVRARILTYYLNVLARRSEPASSWHNRAHRRAGAGSAPATTEGTSS